MSTTIIACAPAPAPAPADIMTRLQLINMFETECMIKPFSKQELLEHPKLNLKLGNGKHAPKLEKIESGKIKDFKKYLRKYTDEILSTASKKQITRYIDVIDEQKLIIEGGNPLIPEIDGGLSLRFIYEKIYNSGDREHKKKSCPSFFLKTPDHGRNISNILLRVYRVVNEC